MNEMISLTTKYLLMTFVFFSGYQGNSPSFTDLNIHRFSDYVKINLHLQNAFEEDFQTLFKSGKEIPVWFEIQLHENQKVVSFNKFRHSISYNPISGEYIISLEERNDIVKTKSFGKLKQIISEIEYKIFYEFKYNKRYTVHISSYLEKIYISSIDKEFNLKSLWRYNMPKIEKEIVIDEKEL